VGLHFGGSAGVLFNIPLLRKSPVVPKKPSNEWYEEDLSKFAELDRTA
jgi:hypothetical protein